MCVCACVCVCVCVHVFVCVYLCVHVRVFVCARGDWLSVVVREQLFGWLWVDSPHYLQ